MIPITDYDSLFKTLLSIEETGYFITPIEVFLKNETVTKNIYYTCIIDSNSYVIFQLTKNIITKKFFFCTDFKGSHRDHDEPAVIEYSIHGNIILKEWFIKGSPNRKNNLKPICIEYKYNKKNVQHVNNSADELKNAGFVIFNYLKKNIGVSCSHILYDLDKSKVVDIFLYNNGQPISIDTLLESYPAINDLSLSNCFDLSTSDIITVLDMIFQ